MLASANNQGPKCETTSHRDGRREMDFEYLLRLNFDEGLIMSKVFQWLPILVSRLTQPQKSLDTFLSCPSKPESNCSVKLRLCNALGSLVYVGKSHRKLDS